MAISARPARGAKHQALRTKRQAPGTKHHAPSATHPPPGTKHLAPRTKHPHPRVEHHDTTTPVLQGGLGRSRVRRVRAPIAGVGVRTCARRWVGFRGLPSLRLRLCRPSWRRSTRTVSFGGGSLALLLRRRGWPSLFSEALGSHQVRGRSPKGRGAPHQPGHAAGDEPACTHTCAGHRWQRGAFALFCWFLPPGAPAVPEIPSLMGEGSGTGGNSQDFLSEVQGSYQMRGGGDPHHFDDTPLHARSIAFTLAFTRDI